MNKHLFPLVIVGIIHAQTAYADAGGCPKGYEPVVDANSGWITCVPTASGSNAKDADNAPPPLADLYMAVVAHPFTPQLWVSSGYLNPNDAERSALTACQTTMFEPADCMVQIKAHNSQYIGRVRNGSGASYFSADTSINNSSAAAMRNCKERNHTCKEGGVIYNTLAQTNNFPEMPVREYSAVTLAMPDQKAPQLKGNYWLISGVPGSKSIPSALANCQKAFGVTCQIVAHSSGGIVALFTTNNGRDYLVDSWEKSWLENNVDKVCDPSLKCKLLQIFDSNQVEDRMVE